MGNITTTNLPKLRIPKARFPVSEGTDAGPVFEVRNLSVYYDAFQALRDVTFDIKRNRITAIIGPSGCGKSTLIRCFNRMNDLIPDARIEGEVRYHGVN